MLFVLLGFDTAGAVEQESARRNQSQRRPQQLCLEGAPFAGVVRLQPIAKFRVAAKGPGPRTRCIKHNRMPPPFGNRRPGGVLNHPKNLSGARLKYSATQAQTPQTEIGSNRRRPDAIPGSPGGLAARSGA